MMEHAAAVFPHEACGLVVAHRGKAAALRAKNLSEQPHKWFDLDPDAWLEVDENNEEVVGIYHSHPNGLPEPSLADIEGCEASGLPWHIISYPAGGYRVIEPTGFVTPYLQRPYVHGVHDCYAIVRDWYNREWNLGLQDFDRSHEWWLKGGDLYNDNFAACGFVELKNDEEVQIGDAFLIQFHSPKPNHAAVYIGNGRILHHVQDRLSCEDTYGGMWQKCTVAHLRHKSRMGAAHG